MAKIKPSIKVSYSISLELTETEARMLEAMAGYGDDAFKNAFYEKLGKHYMQPFASGISSLFSAIREQVKPQLYEVDQSRKAIESALSDLNQKP